MQFKFTASLLLLNAIAFSLIFFLGKQAGDERVQAGGLSGMISREVVEATRIELRGKGLDTPRILERKGSSWRITQPIQWSANYFAINRILNQLQFLEEEASFSTHEIERTGQGLADYGLEDPWIQLTISNANETTELSIGNATEIGNNFYILGPNKKNVFVINRQFVDGLLVDLNDLRTREIFDIPVFEVNALSLQINNLESVGDGRLTVRIARNNNGWVFESPLVAEANTSLVSNAINTLIAAKVVAFKSSGTGDPLLQGLEDPLMRITLYGNKRKQTLLIGNKVTESNSNAPRTYFAKIEGNPTVFSVESKTFDQLREAEVTLRERSILNFDPAALTSIDLSDGDSTVRLQRLETGDWQVIESNAETGIQPYHADPKIVAKLIDTLRNLCASGFAIDSPTSADLDRLGFKKPRRKVQLTVNDQEILLSLAHPESEEEKLYAQSNTADYIYTVDRRSTLKTISLNASHYRNRILEDLPKAAKITRIQLENLLSNETIFEYSLEDPDDIWSERLTSLSGQEQKAVLSLLDGLQKFKVKEYLSESYSEEYLADDGAKHPWAYQLSADIFLPDDADGRTETQTYFFTKRFSGTLQVGTSQLHDVTFLMPQATVNALYIFTNDIELPPEANDLSIPEKPKIEPVPEPLPTAEPEGSEAP